MLFFLYMATINPFVYLVRYASSLNTWRGHRGLHEATVLSLIRAYSDRISDGALRAWVAEQGEFDTYRFAIRPGFHPARRVIVVATKYDSIHVTSC